MRAGGAGLGVEVEHRDAHRLVDERLPGLGVEQALELEAPAHALVADLAPRAVGGDHLHVEPHERLDVADERAVARRRRARAGAAQTTLAITCLTRGSSAARVDVDLSQRAGPCAPTGTSVGGRATG